MEEQKQIPEKRQTEEIPNVKNIVSEEISADSVKCDEGTKKKEIINEQKQVLNGGNETVNDNDFVVKRVRFIELPSINNNEYKYDKLQYSCECDLLKNVDNKLFIRCGLFIIGVLFILLVFISFLNKYRRNRQLLELRNQKKEVQLVKPEIHYNIMITPELIKRLSMTSQQRNQMKMIDEEPVHEENQ